MERKEIFVFGSNEAGRHGMGAALYAVKHYDAEYGRGIGRTGNAYALPTKNHYIQTLSLDRIQKYIDDFREYSYSNSDLIFKITRIGCGLAGYSDKEIAPMFINFPDNCKFDTKWKEYLPINYQYWGTQ